MIKANDIVKRILKNDSKRFNKQDFFKTLKGEMTLKQTRIAMTQATDITELNRLLQLAEELGND